MLWQNQTVSALNIWKPMKLTCDASAPFRQVSNAMLPAWEISSSSFWKLLLLFQPLVLQPQWLSAKLNQKVCSCLKLFASGHIKTQWVYHLPSYNMPLPWMISMSLNFFTLNCSMQMILQNLILLHKWQLISTIFIQLSNIWMVLIQLLSILTKHGICEKWTLSRSSTQWSFPAAWSASCMPTWIPSKPPSWQQQIDCCYAMNLNWHCIRNICWLSGIVLSLCSNSFPVLWIQQRNYISQFASCSFIY